MTRSISRDEEALQMLSYEQEKAFMNQLQMAAKNSSLPEAERKGMLMIAQQFERYKKAYETVKFQKDQLEED
jgi:hypothetical protein